MSKNKKQQRNGFFYYMLDMQQELRDQGRNVRMSEMPVLAGPRWSRLPDAQKQAYNQRAKYEKRAGGVSGITVQMVSAPRPGRMDCTGVLLSERRDYAAEMEERRRREVELMKLSFPPGKDVALEKFFFVDIQSLCEIADREDERFLPCELAAVEFSLHSGIHKSTHKFIDPGAIPMGYRYLAKSTSETSHEIPIEGFDQAERDYRLVLAELEMFVNPERKKELPVIYAKRGNAERVEWCLQWLADKAGVRSRLTKVYELEPLLCGLSAHLDGKSPTVYQAQELLKTSAYDHETGTRCGWHEERENKHCSLGVVNIYCYVLSDCICPKYGIAVTPSHLPERPSGPLCNVVIPSSRHRDTSAPASRSPSLMSIPSDGPGEVSLRDQMGQLSVSVGRGRGRGRGFMYGAVRQPAMIGGLQQHSEHHQ